MANRSSVRNSSEEKQSLTPNLEDPSTSKVAGLKMDVGGDEDDLENSEDETENKKIEEVLEAENKLNELLESADKENSENNVISMLFDQIKNLKEQLASHGQQIGVLADPKVAKRLSLIKVVDVMNETPTRFKSKVSGSFKFGRKVYDLMPGKVDVGPKHWVDLMVKNDQVEYH